MAPRAKHIELVPATWALFCLPDLTCFRVDRERVSVPMSDRVDAWLVAAAPDKRTVGRQPTQWEDSDAWWVNYVGHPIHGAAAGYIWLDHEPDAPLEIGLNRRYWATRGRATAWAAVYSLQFEIGPLSEASIGNVGLRPETTG